MAVRESQSIAIVKVLEIGEGTAMPPSCCAVEVAWMTNDCHPVRAVVPSGGVSVPDVTSLGPGTSVRTMMSKV